MPYDEDAFMRLDSESEESDDNVGIEEADHDNESACSAADGDDADGDDGDDADNKIMEYLLNGYALASIICPSCQTPLIKKFNENQEEKSSSLAHEKHDAGKPIDGIPFCVSCKSVIVTSNAELQIMWRSEYKYLMGVEGAVHLAMNDTSGDAVGIRGATTNRHLLLQQSDDSQHGDDTANDVEIADNGIDRETDGLEGEYQQEDLNAVKVQEGTIENGNSNPNDGRNIEGDANVETRPTGGIDIGMIEYKKRRKIATKVLGAKMMEGYSLQDTQCKRCSMPLMEKPDVPELECVVCPVLEKKIVKDMEKKRLEEEQKQLEEEEFRKKEDSKKEMEQLRKEELQRELERERKLLFELQTVKVENFDEEEKGMIEAIQVAREARAREQERLIAEEKQRQLRRNEEERNRLIEELRIAKQEREMVLKNYEKEKEDLVRELQVSKEKMKIDAEMRRIEAMEAEEKMKKDERLLSLKFIEHKRALDVEREQHERSIEEAKKEHEKSIEKFKKDHERSMEEAKKDHERTMEEVKKEHERTLEEVKKEYERTMEDFKKAQAMIKEEARRREQELKIAEQKARSSEEQLHKWRHMTETERKVAEDMRASAEERLLDAEESILEAEELALEAQNARAMGRGDRSRIFELLRQAEQLRMNAEVEEAAAKQQLQEAERRLENFERMRRMDEQRLTNDLEAARSDFEITKSRNSRLAKVEQEKLRDAENMMIQARFGDNLDVADAGEDWEGRRLLGKKVLAKKVMEGWAVIPKYCLGRMCNFTPLISKGNRIQCVVCEGSGNGKDGFYEEVSSDALLDETMSFVARRKNFSIPSRSTNNVLTGNERRNAASREVGRRIMDGWLLLDRPCDECQMPLMSEAFGAPEVCIFCDIDEDFDDGHDNDMADLDNRSVSSRQSITIDIPDDFDPSDPNAMAALISKATSSMKSGRVGRGRPFASQRDGIPRAIGGQHRSFSKDRVPAAPIPRGPRTRSRSPAPLQFSPEKRNVSSTTRPRSQSSSRLRPESRSMVISADNYDRDDDDTSQLSDDVSVARSVASHSLDAILSKIEDCKAQLKAPTDNHDTASMNKKTQAASLVEKLTAAALAVQKLEASAE